MVCKKIVLVGAGVVNLVTAYHLSRQNYEIVIIDKAPRPGDRRQWQAYGCTFGGENVRMFTYTEADNYNEKGGQLYSKMDWAFRERIDDGGWLVKDLSCCNESEKSWMNDFHQVSAQDAIQFGEEIYQCNIASGRRWDQWMQEAPELFDQVDLKKEIMRLYSDPADFKAAQELHGRLGSMIRPLSVAEVEETCPVFRPALQAGQLGGVMMVHGFTLKVHDLCQNILAYLTAQGADIRWETSFSGIEKNSLGEVEGIWIDDQLERFDHYVLSLGAYAGNTLRNTQTGNQIHGVLGVWMTLPNPYPELKSSLKIHKTGHVGEDTNVTLIEENGQEVLILGSGYGYTGNAVGNEVDCAELEGIYRSLQETAKVYFPEAWEAAQPLSETGRKYCVRGWTPTGLGIFESMPTSAGGQLIITGGNNTGGFTQAPYISEAVVQSLNAESHPMHRLFAPSRMRKLQPEI